MVSESGSLVSLGSNALTLQRRCSRNRVEGVLTIAYSLTEAVQPTESESEDRSSHTMAISGDMSTSATTTDPLGPEETHCDVVVGSVLTSVMYL